MKDKKNIFNNEVSLVLCGEAGQGIKTIESILVSILKKTGLNVFSTKEYMSRIRGGSNSTQIRVSNKNVKAMVKSIDILIPLDDKAIDHVKERINKNTIIITDKKLVKGNYEIIDIPFMQIAKEIGNIIYANVIACGVVFALFKGDINILKKYLIHKFEKKGKEVIDKNIESAIKGYKLGEKLFNESIVQINIKPDTNILDQYFLNGTEAIGYGALAGNCNFISSYPMSPSTGVLTFLSEYSKEMEVIVEQAEDEIAAINMGIGAWYTGARALVTTSGGGFALMGEGISLSGILETPVVIHLAQRPGPATGLPTRTEQGDLELALYSGHGEFPRIILACYNIESTIQLMSTAFDLADKYQVPVIILTDQYFLDSYYNVQEIDFNIKNENYFIKSDKNYKRYQFTKNGISPRGIPGFGTGLVMVDSDEHDEFGRITEKEKIRNQMVEKRLKKLDMISKNSMKPIFTGYKNYEILIVGWGSTYNSIKEAVEILNNTKIGFIHFFQVYPISDEINDYLIKAKRTIIIENNATAQFAKLIKIKTGHNFDHKILKYSGIQFYIEELINEIKEVIGE